MLANGFFWAVESPASVASRWTPALAIGRPQKPAIVCESDPRLTPGLDPIVAMWLLWLKRFHCSFSGNGPRNDCQGVKQSCAHAAAHALIYLKVWILRESKRPSQRRAS